MQSRRLFAALATLAAFLLLVVPAAAAKPHGKIARARVEILSPRQGAQASARAVHVEVKVRGGHFQAYLDGKKVTRRFHGKGLRTATFHVGKVMKLGDADLFVSAGRGRAIDGDATHFFVRRRDDGILALKVRRKGDFVAPRIELRTQQPLRAAKIWLNGRRIERSLDEEADEEGLNGRLEAARLRFGRNRLKVMIAQEGGLFARRALTFWVPRDQPIADAGRDRMTGLGGKVRLDASSSRPPLRLLKLTPAPGAKTAKGQASASVASPAEAGSGKVPLAYEWKILEAPEGSEAKVLKPASEEAELVPDVPGEYVAMVTVTAPDGSTSTDDVTVESSAASEPMGLPIQTITAAGAIQIGEPTPPSSKAPSNTYERFGNWVQMLVLDPATGTPLPGPWDERSGVPEKPNRPGVLGFDSGEGAKLLEAVKRTEAQHLVVLSGQGLAVTMSKSDAENLKKAIELLGGTVSAEGTTPDGAADLANGQWSLIGHEGLVPGGAYQNAFHTEAGIEGFLGGATGQPGSLNGYFQSGLNAIGLGYISPEVVSIDTKWTENVETPPSPTQNVIKVGDTKYPSTPIDTGEVSGCPCQLAIQLLILEQGTLKPTISGTFGIFAADGSTIQGGVNGLDYELHQAVTNHVPGASSLVIMQDFGSSKAVNWPAGNSVPWLEDGLPDSSYSPEWEGFVFPNQRSQLAKTWNQNYPFGSVAGNLGILVDNSFHDVVANYRRPFFDQATKRIEPRDWGGLTAIASTNLSDRSSAFGVGQGSIPPKGDNPLVNNGRITGALTRNHQGQWELTGQASGAGYPNLVQGVPSNSPANEFASSSLPELVLSPRTKFPCSPGNPQPCSNDEGEVHEAMRYIVGQVPLYGGVEDARADYTSDTIAWGSIAGDLKKGENVQCAGHADFKTSTCEELRQILKEEAEDLDQLKAGFGALTELFTGSRQEIKQNVSKAMNKVNASVAHAHKDLLKQVATYNISSWIKDALFVASGLLQGAVATEDPAEVPIGLKFSPGGISALGYLIELGESLSPFFEREREMKTAELEPDNTSLIKDKAQNLSYDLEARLTASVRVLKHFENVLRTDPVKLKKAAENFGHRWSLEEANELRFERVLALGAARSMYETAMPLAFDQWIIGPRETNINPNGPEELPSLGYKCTWINGEGETDHGYDPPLKGLPKSMSAMNSVAWGAQQHGPERDYTIRFLKEKDDNIELIHAAAHSIDEGNVLVRHRGDGPEASLTDPLFAEPSELTPPGEPQAFGIDKEAFFGMEAWKMRQLQCGFAK
jgi:hypothetical protein